MKRLFHSLSPCLLVSLSLTLPALAVPSQIVGRQSPDATEQIQLDLPGQEHMKNSVGTDGSCLLVFTSIEITAH